MLFDLNGEKFKVSFYRNNNNRRMTIAEMENLSIPSRYHVLGLSFCNPKDRFEKSKGRKIALTKLLIAMTEYNYSVTKEDRARIWEIYFKEHKK
jgi:hypothetical protein